MDPKKRAELARNFTKARDAQTTTMSFMGAKPPPTIVEFSALIEAAPTAINTDLFTEILQYTVEHLKGNELEDAHWSKLLESTGLPDSVVTIVFTAQLHILRVATRSRTPLDVFKKDCLDVLSVPKEYTAILVEVLQNWEAKLKYIAFNKKKITLAGIANLKWRVDVTIMTSKINRLFRPSILMQITTTHGEIYTFEMSSQAFHQLRFTVAKLLKEMDNLDNKPILKIDKQM